jgi:hypothetical protein
MPILVSNFQLLQYLDVISTPPISQNDAPGILCQLTKHATCSRDSCILRKLHLSLQFLPTHEYAYNSGHFIDRVLVACIVDSFADILCITVFMKESSGLVGNVSPALTKFSRIGAVVLTTNVRESTIICMRISMASLEP